MSIDSIEDTNVSLFSDSNDDDLTHPENINNLKNLKSYSWCFLDSMLVSKSFLK